MMQIAALGSQEFIIGFQLTGIRYTFEAAKDLLNQIKTIIKNKEIGIVIYEEKMFENLEPHDRQELEWSVSPVFVPLSEAIEQEALRRLIRKSIGIDLWKVE